MEIYDNNEEGDDDSDDGIEVEDDDDDEKEESLSPVNGAGSSKGTCTVTFRTLYRMMSFYSILPCTFLIWTYFSLVISHYVCIMLNCYHLKPRGLLSIMAYTGRLRLKGVRFSGFRYIKGYGFHKFRYVKG